MMFSRRFLAVATKVLAHPRLPITAPLSTNTTRFLSTSSSHSSTTSRPGPPPTGPSGSDDKRDDHNQQQRPPTRMTGDEVEDTADNPMGMVGQKAESAVKGAAGTVKDILNRDDRLYEVAEEAYNSVPKFHEGIGIQAERGKEHLEGHVWPQDRHQKTIKLGEEEEKTQAKEEHQGGVILGKIKETVKHTLQEGVEKLKGGVEATTEAIKRQAEQHEDEMVASAEEQRKKFTKAQCGEAVEEEEEEDEGTVVEEEEEEVDEKGEVDSSKLEKKYEEKHYESVVGAPVGPKK